MPSAIPLLCVTSLLVLVGCRTAPATYLPDDTTKYSIENTGKFARLDPATLDAILCTGLREERNSAGRLEVVANVKNRGSSSIQVQVRCVFKDTQGFAIGDETPWQTVTLADEGTEAVRFSAGNGLAQKYTIIVRSAP